MTQGEKMIQEQIAAQKKSQDDSFKQNARFKALDCAQYLRPPVNYIQDPLSNSLQKSTIKVQPEYDVTAAAEKIYQWLIKVLR